MRATLSPSRTIEETLGVLVRLLERRRIPYMVMGGLALSVWGRVRVTHDVDVAIAVEAPQEKDFLNVLQHARFLSDKPRAIVGHRLLVCRYLKATKGLPIQVDLFLARGAYQREALERAVPVSLSGRRLRVIAPEDLILYKLIAHRPIDTLDVQTIFEEQKGRLDKNYLTRWAKRLGISKRLSRARKSVNKKLV